MNRNRKTSASFSKKKKKRYPTFKNPSFISKNTRRYFSFLPISIDSTRHHLSVIQRRVVSSSIGPTKRPTRPPFRFSRRLLPLQPPPPISTFHLSRFPLFPIIRKPTAGQGPIFFTGETFSNGSPSRYNDFSQEGRSFRQFFFSFLFLFFPLPLADKV